MYNNFFDFLKFTVTAIDLDEGINGHLTFSLDSSYFEVENVDDKTASIKVNRLVKYHNNKQTNRSIWLNTFTGLMEISISHGYATYNLMFT